MKLLNTSMGTTKFEGGLLGSAPTILQGINPINARRRTATI